jgi:hypothetical protein
MIDSHYFMANWRNRFTFCVVLGIISVGFTVYRVWPQPEPLYKGRPLSEWYLDIKRVPLPNFCSTPEFQTACGHFYAAVEETGTNGLPFLLEMLKSKEYSGMRTKLVDWANESGKLHHHFWTQIDRVDMEQTIIECLGHKASPAVPALVDILKTTKNPYAKYTILSTLPFVSPEPQMVRGALLRALQDRDEWVREAATNALRKIDPEAIPDGVLEQALYKAVDDWQHCLDAHYFGSVTINHSDYILPTSVDAVIRKGRKATNELSNCAQSGNSTQQMIARDCLLIINSTDVGRGAIQKDRISGIKYTVYIVYNK